MASSTSLPLTLSLMALLLPLLPLAAGEVVNGMDMSMDDGMSLASGMMMPYLHFTRGDILWFAGWVPQSAGAMFGACIGLFVLALVDRWLAAVRALMDAHWREEGRAAVKKCDRDDSKGKIRKLTLRAPPFVFAHDGMRGVMHAVQAALGFAFMLAVMTFQAAFILTIALGLGIGEMMFGRYGAAAAAAH